MIHSPSTPPLSQPTTQNNGSISTGSSSTSLPDIPVEIVSEDEMAFLEAALASTRAALSSSSILSTRTSSLLQCNSRSIGSITSPSKKRLSCDEAEDIEDVCRLRSPQKTRTTNSFFLRFRKKGLSVTDITCTEWCEKQMEFNLLFGSRKTTKAMKAGAARHLELENEVVKKVLVHVVSDEDKWALKFISFINGIHQLLFDGLTRELPLIGFVEGVWLTGIVDEIRMPKEEDSRNPIFIDTKTRVRETLPSEPQSRNGRLQLMIYKYLWDNVVTDKFSTKAFLSFFSLDPYRMLCEETKQGIATAGISAMTLDDVISHYKNTCELLLPANEHMILRYESQKDKSILGEDEFTYDLDWLKSQFQVCLEFWRGEREGNFIPTEERWKCRCCQYAAVCPMNSPSEPSSPAKSQNPTSSQS